MAISISCEACGRDYSLKDEMAGKRFKCKDCGEIVSVPAGRKPGAKTPAPKKKADDDDDFLSALNAASRDRGEVLDEDGDAGDEGAEFEAPKRSVKPKSKSAGKTRANSSGGTAAWAQIGGGVFGALVILGFLLRVVGNVAGVAGGAASWREFSPPDGSYKVQMPGAPKYQTKIEDGIQLSIYIAETRNFACAVSQGRLPPLAANIPDALFLATLQQGMQTAGQTVHSAVDTRVSGRPAKEIRYAKAGLESTSRIFLDAGQIYEIQFIAKGNPPANEVSRFLDSFQLSGAAAAAPPNAAPNPSVPMPGMPTPAAMPNAPR